VQEIAKGRIFFIIAHRLLTLRPTDRIITLDVGRLIEDGSQDDLISPAAAMPRSIACRLSLRR
jgi:ABC-type bacteriocin/lantibiotic exporter with double-glycine peptidase domain